MVGIGSHGGRAVAIAPTASRPGDRTGGQSSTPGPAFVRQAATL